MANKSFRLDYISLDPKIEITIKIQLIAQPYPLGSYFPSFGTELHIAAFNINRDWHI